MTPEKILGVDHGSGLYPLSGGVHELPARPSRNLQREICTIPKGAKIGVEFHPDVEGEQSVFLGHRERSFHFSGVDYWTQVIDICQRAGLDVVYLDDPGLARKAAYFHFQADEGRERMAHDDFSMQMALENEDANGEVEALDRSLKIASTMAYVHQVLGDYTLQIERDVTFCKRIAEERPYAVILGRAHGDVFFLKPEVVPEGRELFPHPAFFGEELKRCRQSGRQKFCRVEPDPGSVVERELLIRRYNAVTLGRIRPEETPDFIGYWMREGESCPVFGIFEVYKDRGGNGGLIIDGLGDAKFHGSLDSSGKITFTKKYIPEATSRSAVRKMMIYKGEWHNDHFEGNFGLASGKAPLLPHDCFVLYPFSPRLRITECGFVDVESWEYQFFNMELQRALNPDVKIGDKF